jgi:DtxR family transcriptional regulator, iron-dependent repressor
LQQATDAYDSLVAETVLARGARQSPAVEDYLETIYELDEAGIPPMRARLVERLGVSAPTVSETVARLEREGYVTLDDQRVLRLTGTGLTAATAVMRRHRLAERLLVDVLKVPWSQVHEEAHRLEHAISDTLEPYLVDLLGDPGTCPHGNPIPGSINHQGTGGQAPLNELPPNVDAVVRRIDEEIEARPDAMRTLEQRLLMPGYDVRIVAVKGNQISVETKAGIGDVSPDIAAKIYVSR